ncbi:DUF1045 domain-containing protein [Fuscovulum ytuae]|uniref:DUF1045 domain-containing protein n=2 Tax=Fuscovulum ytuae TaxID=3042299 RepID=A0ABY8Q223_9RHOB|nr:DUF1045 domain-containing protein [Fuscovulum sp. YMD61]WGV14818.1 DUF1045 domain-containing protein [Fuscovulum sp. YMD61]
MDQMKRYAVYYAPPEGDFASRAAGWLGWDAVRGEMVSGPKPEGLPDGLGDITADPRKYGFHGTIRAPFRPADGLDRRAVEEAVAALAARLAPVTCDGLVLENLQGFLALTPAGCEAALLELGAAVVEGTDHLRAPLTEAEIARRRPERLSPRQRELLARWGYPYVMEEFRFHLTLTDRLAAEVAGPVAAALAAYFAPVLPRPFEIAELCLFGEDAAGRFHLLSRHALTG